jgi:hypothetical protein
MNTPAASSCRKETFLVAFSRHLEPVKSTPDIATRDSVPHFEILGDGFVLRLLRMLIKYMLPSIALCSGETCGPSDIFGQIIEGVF